MHTRALVLPWILLLTGITSAAPAATTAGCNDAPFSMYQYIEQQMDPSYCSKSPWTQQTGTARAQAASACSCLHPGINTAPPTPTPTPTQPSTSINTRPPVQFTGSVANPWIKTPLPTPTGKVCGLPLDQTYVNSALLHHNYHRANHGVGKLTWDCNLATWARTLSQQCSMGHNNQIGVGGYGQNIATGPDWNNVGVAITDVFYNSEIPNFAPWYGHTNPGDGNFYQVFYEGPQFGHATQIIWKNTTKVGCFTNYCGGGIANAPDLNYITVCNYMNPGHVLDQWAKNVFPPGNLPNITGSSTIPMSYL